MLFRSNLIPDMVRYQLGLILEYIFLYVKFYGALKYAPKSVNVFKKKLLNKNKKMRDFALLLVLQELLILLGILPCGVQTLYLWFVIQL